LEVNQTKQLLPRLIIPSRGRPEKSATGIACDRLSFPGRGWSRRQSVAEGTMAILPADESVRIADLRRRCWISKASSHEPCRLSRKPDSTKRKSRDGSNSSAKSRMSGAHTSRATIRAIPYRSCAGSIVFNFSTTGVAGGFYQFTGSTKLRSTRFRKNIFNVRICGNADASCSAAPADADGCRGNILCRALTKRQPRQKG